MPFRTWLRYYDSSSDLSSSDDDYPLPNFKNTKTSTPVKSSVLVAKSVKVSEKVAANKPCSDSPDSGTSVHDPSSSNSSSSATFLTARQPFLSTLKHSDYGSNASSSKLFLTAKDNLSEKPDGTPISRPSKLGQNAGVQPPNWNVLLLDYIAPSSMEGVSPILSYPDCDTYFEDCKLAGDVALNHLTKYDLPVFSGLRNSNQNQVSRALRSLRQPHPLKKKKVLNEKEEVLVFITLLDFLTCCCQEGNLLPLYEKCKNDKKRQQLSQLTKDLSYLVSYINIGGWSLKQLQSLEKFVLASLNRIPETLYVNNFSLKLALKRKITELEREEKKKKEPKTEYDFNDDYDCTCGFCC